jgi:hypothetical protein
MNPLCYLVKMSSKVLTCFYTNAQIREDFVNIAEASQSRDF